MKSRDGIQSEHSPRLEKGTTENVAGKTIARPPLSCDNVLEPDHSEWRN